MTAVTITGRPVVDTAARTSLPERIAKRLGPTYNDQVVSIISITARLFVIGLLGTHFIGVNLHGYGEAIKVISVLGSFVNGSIKCIDCLDVCPDDRRRAFRSLFKGLVWFGSAALAFFF